MNVTELLQQFADPSVIHSLSLADKLLAGLATTLLGMGITFAALIILQFIISWMDRLINRDVSRPAAQPTPAKELVNDELVAVLTATIAVKMNTCVDRIVIRNIEKIEDRSPPWNIAGITEQMNSRF